MTTWQPGLGEGYDERWRRLEASGESVHGEADLVSSLVEPGSRVLDAGCGTGRVAIELARRGYDVTGVDVDESMLSVARAKAPELQWELGDLSSYSSSRAFDLVVLAGNVMVFVAPGTEGAVVAALGEVLRPGGLLVAGFQLTAAGPAGRSGIGLEEYDGVCAAAGLELEHRWATWDREPFADGDYAVSVHRKP